MEKTNNAVMLPLSKLQQNNGQIEGLPKNPRILKDDKYKKLKASLEADPEMMALREILVYPHKEKYVVIGGNMRLKVLRDLGYKEAPCKIIPEDTSVEKLKAYTIKDNAGFGDWDYDMLANEWDSAELDAWGVDVWQDEEEEQPTLEAKEDDFDEEKDHIEVCCKRGDIWQLGEHRLMCGDSIDLEDVKKLMGGGIADLVFTDPPYGMKKEAEGVLNDNQNNDQLLEFNKKWIPISFAMLSKVGSWYCWGIDEPLMDIYSEILKPMTKQRGEDKLTFRNLITWDKGQSGQGVGVSSMRMYFPNEEKCIFVMRGRQTYGETIEDYWEGFEPLRKKLDAERKKTGLSTEELIALAGASSITHWWSKSQWAFPSEERYKALQKALRSQECDGFRQEYDEIRQEYDEIRQEWYKTRGYFDNTHDNMTSVWPIPITSQKEREDCGGHATPKPVALCERAIKSSCPEGGSVLDLFGGSGTTLIAAEQLGRKCYMMELDPHYCDVIIARWEKLTGETATKIN